MSAQKMFVIAALGFMLPSTVESSLIRPENRKLGKEPAVAIDLAGLRVPASPRKTAKDIPETDIDINYPDPSSIPTPIR